VEGKRIISEEEYLQHQVVPQPDAPFTILDWETIRVNFVQARNS
jgi:hypothetical protein